MYKFSNLTYLLMIFT